MRKITVYNYSKKPEQALGQVVLEDGGTISLHGFSPQMVAELQRGVLDRKTEKRITPEAGLPFFEGVLRMYSGAYVRAVEQTTYEPILKG